MPPDEPIRAMTVTIRIDGGPTVCLDVDLDRAYDHPELDDRTLLKDILVACTNVTVLDQPGVLSVADVIEQAAAVLFMFHIDQKHWPADLRPAWKRRGGEEEVSHG